MPREFPPCLTERLHQLGRETLKIVLPSPCVSCESDLPLIRRVGSCCLECWTSLPRLAEPTCERCGTPLQIGRRCLECPRGRRLQSIGSWGEYTGPLRDVIHAWKFRNHDFLTGPLADLLHQCWRRRPKPRIDAVLTVPSSRRRTRQHGFDHALSLAESFAKRARLPFQPRLVRRIKENEVQSRLPRSRRIENVRGVFEASARASGATILIVDDVETTGATIDAVTIALKRAGAASVHAITIARTS